MTIENILLVFAVITAFMYMFLGLLAHSYQSKEKNDKGWTLSPVWALFPAAYDEKGQALCSKGRVLFWISTALTLLWMLLVEIR